MKTTADDFVRGDSTDLGANWDAGYTSTNNLQIVGNRVRATVISADSMETHNGTIGWDQFAQVRLDTIVGAGTNIASILLRWSNAALTSGYEFAARNGSNRSLIRRWNAGSLVSLAASDAQTWANGDILRGEVFENTVSLFRNGVLVIRATDGDPVRRRSGKTGLNLFTSVLADCEVSNFFSGEVSVPIRPRGKFPLAYL